MGDATYIINYETFLSVHAYVKFCKSHTIIEWMVSRKSQISNFALISYRKFSRNELFSTIIQNR